MRDIRRRGSVRCGADARLVGKETALNTEDQTGTGDSSENRLEVECIREDIHEHGRDVLNIQNKHKQRKKNIQDAHHGNDNFREVHDPLPAAHQAVLSCQKGEDSSDSDLRPMTVPAVGHKGGLQIVGGKQIETECVCQDQEQAENESRHP